MTALAIQPKPDLLCAIQAREALRTAWANQPTETPGPFGITTAPGRRGNNARRSTAFYWRNYLTGMSGYLVIAPEEELQAVAKALLDEIRALRARAHKKSPEKEGNDGHVIRFRTARAAGAGGG
jgi:hypothetical protein